MIIIILIIAITDSIHLQEKRVELGLSSHDRNNVLHDLCISPHMLDACNIDAMPYALPLQVCNVVNHYLRFY